MSGSAIDLIDRAAGRAGGRGSSVGKTVCSWVAAAAQEGRLLDERDAEALPGKVERRAQAGDAAADDEGLDGPRRR